jgi:hypothetical protein
MNRDPCRLVIFSDEEQLEEHEEPDKSDNPKESEVDEEDRKMTMMTNPPKMCNSMLSNHVFPRQQLVLTKRGKEEKIE